MPVLSGFCLKGAQGSEMEEVLLLTLFYSLLGSIQKRWSHAALGGPAPFKAQQKGTQHE